MLLPTGAGEPVVLDNGGHGFEEAAFFPDGKRLLAVGDRTCVIDLETRKVRPVAPEGVGCEVVSPDGKEMACLGPEEVGVIYSIEGGDSRPIPGFLAGQDHVVQWSADGRSLFVRHDVERQEVFRLDLATGRRELWHEFTPAENFGFALYYFAMTPDARAYAYSTLNEAPVLYLVTGLR